MIINPIATVQAGNFGVFPTGTPDGVLVYAVDPDGDGVERSEPDTGELILAYPALGKKSSIKVILRGDGSYDVQGSITGYVKLYNGTNLLGQQSVVLYGRSLQTYTLTFSFPSQSLLYPRVGFSTFEVLSQAPRLVLGYVRLTMLVLEDAVGDNTPPPFRKATLVPMNDLRAPYWMLVVETNTVDPIEIPAGFKVVSVQPPLRLVGKRVLPPVSDGRTHTYVLTLCEVP